MKREKNQRFLLSQRKHVLLSPLANKIAYIQTEGKLDNKSWVGEEIALSSWKEWKVRVINV